MVELLYFFCLLFVSSINCAEIGASKDECMVSRCSDQGPAVRFPFRLKDQPENCGYPGFELSCTETNQTILDMPFSVKLSVKNIKYKSREIVVEDPNNCLQSQLQNLRLSASPFNFKLNHSFELQDFTFFNCSANRSDSSYFKSIKSFSKSCSFLPGNPLYAVDSRTSLTDLDVSSCRRIYNLSLPTYYIYEGENRLYLKWEESICGNCEAEGKKCRLKKSNGKKPETECITGTVFISYPGCFIFFIYIYIFCLFSPIFIHYSPLCFFVIVVEKPGRY